MSEGLIWAKEMWAEHHNWIYGGGPPIQGANMTPIFHPSPCTKHEFVGVPLEFSAHFKLLKCAICGQLTWVEVSTAPLVFDVPEVPQAH